MEQKYTAYMPDDDMEKMSDPMADVDRTLLFQDQVKCVRRALAQLPEEQRQILEYRVIEKMDYEAIAQRIDISPDAVRKRISRARARLREIMGREE